MCGTSLFKVFEPKIATLSSYEFFWLHAMQGGVFLSNLVFIRLMTCVSFDTLDQRVYWLNQYIAIPLLTWVAGTGRFHLLLVILTSDHKIKIDVASWQSAFTPSTANTFFIISENADRIDCLYGERGVRKRGSCSKMG